MIDGFDSGLFLGKDLSISFDGHSIELSGDELKSFIMSNMDQQFHTVQGCVKISDFILFLFPIKETIEAMLLVDLQDILEKSFEFEKMNIDVIISKQVHIENEKMNTFYVVDLNDGNYSTIDFRDAGIIQINEKEPIPASMPFTLYEAISSSFSELPDVFESFSKDSFQL